MKSTEAPGVGCRIIGEFDDDAAACPQGEAEFVPVKELPASSPTMAETLDRSLPFSEETAGPVKKFWLKVIHRFTEPIPERKGRLRVLHSQPPNRGDIIVEYGRRTFAMGRVSGCEIEVSDNLFLTLYKTMETRHEKQKGFDEDSYTPVPWIEIVNIRFEVVRPEAQVGPNDSPSKPSPRKRRRLRK